MATIATLDPLTLPRDMVRVVFPIAQPELGDPGLPTLAAVLADVDFRWNYAGATGSPVTVTFGFSATAPGYSVDYVGAGNTYRAFTDPEKDSVRAVFDAYEAVCGITFNEVASGAQMVCRIASELDAVGIGNFPPFSAASGAEAGDFFIDEDAAGQAYIAFHEIGHSLGLAHAFDTYKPVPGDYGTVFAGASGRLLSVVDQGSVPNPYYFYEVTPGNYAWGSIFHPVTPMPLDILALQMMYGKNTATNAGNTSYTYAVNPNIYETIWDGSGNDTINCSNQVNPCLITLVGGSYSTIGLRDPFAGVPGNLLDFYVDDATRNGIYPADRYNDGSNSLAIAFDCVIENATGGSAADRLIGNSVANRLTGGGGNDTLAGSAGNDTLIGGIGNDVLDGSVGIDRLQGDAGNDRLTFGSTAETHIGGIGVDTLRLLSSLNLTTTLNARVVDIETIDMTGGGNDTLTVNASEVLAISTTTNTLTVLGNAGDRVNLLGAFALQSTAGGFETWKLGAAVVKIETELNVI